MSLNGEQTNPNQPQSGTLDERCRGRAPGEQSTPLVVPTLEPSDGTPSEGGTIVYESHLPSSQKSVVGGDGLWREGGAADSQRMLKLPKLQGSSLWMRGA
ncbi:hypothetical protein CCHR01_15539 [Colletotrichum chrysophilum]|uniref:Uncharacterized protein n=1 Tax=Colletotrichum chrysophilum TaxID=1836956 RepID=A0AAD9A5F3_9PEZI|nr:hypothetical protein CCHR01_15539 [Colletotrichum chrysophilum]